MVEMKNKIDWVHLGMLYDEYDEKFLMNTNKRMLTAAGTKFQWNFISGIEYYIGKPVKIINSLPVETYPRYATKMVIKKREWSHAGESKDVNIGCINLIGVKQCCRFLGLVFELLRLKEDSNRVISIYDFNLYIIFAALLFRRVKGGIICLVISDLPGQLGIISKKKGISFWIKNMLGKYYMKLARKADACVVLTHGMVESLGIEEEKYVVIEGFADIGEASTRQMEDSETKRIVYAGNICEECGIFELIDAVSRIEMDNVQLHVYGFGPLKDFCIEQSKQNPKIVVHDMCSRKELLEAERNAYLLVNPRRKSEITKYFFPSKTFEYMLSGRPMVGFFLDCFSVDYRNYFFILDENDPDGLYQGLKNILNMPREEIEQMGQRARDFVMSKKNNIVQIEKLISKIEEIMELK